MKPTTEQVMIFTFFAVLLLWWAASPERQALWIKRIGFALGIVFCIAASVCMWGDPFVVFANDGPLGQMKRADGQGMGAVGLVAAATFVGGVLLAVVIRFVVLPAIVSLLDKLLPSNQTLKNHSPLDH